MPKNRCSIHPDLEAIHSCPIVGGPISDITCIELSSWADFILDTDQVWLEYLDKIREFCKKELKIDDDKEIAKICNDCPNHWVDAKEE